MKNYLIKKYKNLSSVAGCRVQSGRLDRKQRLKVIRGDQTVYDGEIALLKHHKDEVQEISQGKECGLMVADGGINFVTGDVVKSYFIRKEPRETRWDPGF